MREGRRMLLVAAAITVLVAGVWAGVGRAEQVDRTLKASPTGKVEVENTAGSVEVIGWDRAEVQVTGRLSERAERLDFERDGDRVFVIVRLPRNARDVEGSHLTIHVPAESQVQVSTVSADQSVGQVVGDLELDSISGDVRVESDAPRMKVETVSGEIKIEGQAERLQLKSISGDITVGGAGGDLSLETVSGDAGIQGRTFDRIQAESVSGDLRFRGELAGQGDFSFSTHSGDVRLDLVGEPDVELQASTFSGEIQVPAAEQRHGKHSGPGRRVSAMLGDGSGSLEIETFSGDIEIETGK